MDLMVTREEIKEALWSSKAYKAPGLDGLHAGFFLEVLVDCRGFSAKGSH